MGDMLPNRHGSSVILEISLRRTLGISWRGLSPVHQRCRSPCEPTGSRPGFHRWCGRHLWLQSSDRSSTPRHAAPLPWPPRNCRPCRLKPGRAEHFPVVSVNLPARYTLFEGRRQDQSVQISPDGSLRPHRRWKRFPFNISHARLHVATATSSGAVCHPELPIASVWSTQALHWLTNWGKSCVPPSS